MKGFTVHNIRHFPLAPPRLMDIDSRDARLILAARSWCMLHHARIDPLPRIRGYLLSGAVAMRFGAGDLTSVYAYLPDFDRELASCTFHHRQGGGTYRTIVDTSFPFDTTLPVSGTAPVEVFVEVQLKQGAKETSPVARVLLE